MQIKTAFNVKLVAVAAHMHTIAAEKQKQSEEECS